MSFMFFPFAVLFIVVVLPIWIIAHYATRWRTAKPLSSGEEKMISELWESAIKMEDRIKILERILDKEAPDWRARV